MQVRKCVKLWVLVDISNRTKNAEVLRFNASKFGMQVKLKDHVDMKDGV